MIMLQITTKEHFKSYAWIASPANQLQQVVVCALDFKLDKINMPMMTCERKTTKL